MPHPLMLMAPIMCKMALRSSLNTLFDLREIITDSPPERGSVGGSRRSHIHTNTQGGRRPRPCHPLHPHVLLQYMNLVVLQYYATDMAC